MKRIETDEWAEEVKKRLSYDPYSGVIVWKWCDEMPRWWNMKHAGYGAGRVDSHGYITIEMGGETYKAHRIAWVIKTGSWPSKEIDHKNGNRSDNRWENLREANRLENSINRAILSSNNKSGITGVHWENDRKKWRAQIQYSGKKINLGRFADREDAIKARREAEEKYFGEFAPK